MGLRDKGIEAVAASAAVFAVRAHESGLRYYCPVLPKPSALAAAVDTWGIALEAITSNGWRLHTWATADDGTARPLFERVVDSPTIRE